jgi:hypothetical protein
MKRLKTLIQSINDQTIAACLEFAALSAALTAAFIAIFKFLAADTPQMTELFKAVAWPVVACVALFALREPISHFLAGLAQRVTKFSVFNLEFELTEVEAKGVSGPIVNVIRSGPMVIFDSAGGIFSQLREQRRADYVQIDLGEGDNWLFSRLFIVAAMFGGIRGVRCVVFTAGVGAQRNRFVGLASLQDVRWQIARVYPSFELALATAMSEAILSDPTTQMLRADGEGYDPYVATSIVNKFLAGLQSASPSPATGWTQIKSLPSTWERSIWVDETSLQKVLGDSLSRAQVHDPRSRPKQDVARSVLAQGTSFVAGVTSGMFSELFDRTKMLERLAEQVATADDGAGKNQ